MISSILHYIQYRILNLSSTIRFGRRILLYYIVSTAEFWSLFAQYVSRRLLQQYSLEKDFICSVLPPAQSPEAFVNNMVCTELYPVQNSEVFTYNMVWKNTSSLQHYIQYRILKPYYTLYILDGDFVCSPLFKVQNPEPIFHNMDWNETLLYCIVSSAGSISQVCSRSSIYLYFFFVS